MHQARCAAGVHGPPSYSAAGAAFLEWQRRTHAMNKPASAPDTMPPHELPPPEEDEVPEGTNATIHHPDEQAERFARRVLEDEKLAHPWES